MPAVDEIITPLMFTVPGIPVAQPRVKAFSRGDRTGVYTPTKTASGKSNGIAEFKAAIKLAASQFRGELLTGPLRVDIECVFPRPVNMVWKKRPMPRCRKVTKPDKDNCEKAICDALTGVLWVDDNQVCDGRTSKWHAAGGEDPHVKITVISLDD